MYKHQERLGQVDFSETDYDQHPSIIQHAIIHGWQSECILNVCDKKSLKEKNMPHLQHVNLF